jgi:hypothetical protein
MIRNFKDLISIDQVCRAIDGTHIKVHDKPKLRFIPVDYWNWHNHHNVLLVAICDSNLFFGNVAVYMMQHT